MLKQDVQNEVNASLKAGRKTVVKVLRFLLSEIKYKEIDKKSELTDEEIGEVITKEVKKRRDAIELFKKGKRDDLVKDEEGQIKILLKYL